MSSEILVAVIAASPGLAAAVVSWSTSRRTKELATTTAHVRATTERVRHQVENNHDTNLREEQDVRHEELLSGLRDVRRDVGGIRGDIRTLHAADQQLDQRIQRVESAALRPKE